MLRIVCVTGQYTDCSATCRLNEESGEPEHFDWQQQAAERGQESLRAACHRARGKGMAVHITQQYTYMYTLLCGTPNYAGHLSWLLASSSWICNVFILHYM